MVRPVFIVTFVALLPHTALRIGKQEERVAYRSIPAGVIVRSLYNDAVGNAESIAPDYHMICE
jgi:hypothetical protein